ncbi:hypothetical protein GN956_G10399 [Arapaima gigas]
MDPASPSSASSTEGPPHCLDDSLGPETSNGSSRRTTHARNQGGLLYGLGVVWAQLRSFLPFILVSCLVVVLVYVLHTIVYSGPFTDPLFFQKFEQRWPKPSQNLVHDPAKDPYRMPRFELLLLEELQRQQRLSMFCDTVLQAGGISVPVHSCILSAFSPQFAQTLSTAPSLHAGQNRLLEFQTIDAGTLLKLVGFFYTGKLDVKGGRERDEVITAISKLGIGGLVNLGRQGDEDFGVNWEGPSELFVQVEGRKEAGVQTESQTDRQDKRCSVVEEGEQRTILSKAVRLAVTTRDKETQIEPGEITHNWRDSGSQTNVSTDNGTDPDALQPTDVDSNIQPFHLPLVTSNSSDSQQSPDCVPLQYNSQLGPFHPNLQPLQSCPKPSEDHISSLNRESSVVANGFVTHTTDEGNMILTAAHLESSSFSETVSQTLTVSDTALSVLTIFDPELDAVASGPATVTATQASVVPDPGASLTSIAAECIPIANIGSGSSLVMNTAHTHSEPPLSSCLPSSVPEITITQPAPSSRISSQGTTTTAEKVGGALALEGGTTVVDCAVVALEDEDTVGLEMFEGNIPGFINYFLNTSSSKKESAHAATGLRKREKKSRLTKRMNTREVQRNCEKPRGELAAKEDENDCGVLGRPVELTGDWRQQFGTILESWRKGQGGGLVDQWSGIRTGIEHGQSIKLKLKRHSNGRLWEIVKVAEKAGMAQALRGVGKARQRKRGHQHHRACQPSLSKGTVSIVKKRRGRARIHPIPCTPPRQLFSVPNCGSLPQGSLLPNSTHPLQQTPGPGPLHTLCQPPDQISSEISVSSEEPAEQIEKLLEDILMGLNLLPPNSPVGQNVHSNSYLPKSTGGQSSHHTNPEPAVRSCDMQQQQEPEVVQSSQGGVTPAESSTRAFSDFRGTAAPSVTSPYFGTDSNVLPTPCSQTPEPLLESFLSTMTEPQGCHHPSFSTMYSQSPSTFTRSSSECDTHLAKTAIPFSHCSLLPEEIQRCLLTERSDSVGSPVGFSQQTRKNTWEPQGVPKNLSVGDSTDPTILSLEVYRTSSTDACRITQHTAGEPNKILDHNLQSSEKLSGLQRLEEEEQNNQEYSLDNRMAGQGREMSDTLEFGLNRKDMIANRANETGQSGSEADVQDQRLQITSDKDTVCHLEKEQSTGSRTNTPKHPRKTCLATSNKQIGAQYALSSGASSRYQSSKEPPRWVSSFYRGLQIPSSLMNEAESILSAPSHKGLQDPKCSCSTKLQTAPTAFSKGSAQSCDLQKRLKNGQDFARRLNAEHQQLKIRSQSKTWTLRTRIVKAEDNKVQTKPTKRKLRVKRDLQTLMQTQDAHLDRKVSRKCLRDRNIWLGKDKGCRLYPDRYDRPKRRNKETVGADFSRNSKMQVRNTSGAVKVLHDFSTDSWKMRECVVKLVDINMYVGKSPADHAEQPRSRNSEVKMCSSCTEKSSTVKLEKVAEINNLIHKKMKSSDVSSKEHNARHQVVSVNNTSVVQQQPHGKLKKAIQEVTRDATMTSGQAPDKISHYCGLEKGENRMGQKQFECSRLLMRARKRKMEDLVDVRCVKPRLDHVGSRRDADPVHTVSPQKRPCSAITLQSPTPGSSMQIGEQIKPYDWSPSLTAIEKSTMKNSSGSVLSSSAFEQIKELLLPNQYRRTMVKFGETETCYTESEVQGAREGERGHREREESGGDVLWKERSYTNEGKFPDTGSNVEQSIGRTAVESSYKKTAEDKALEEQVCKCSEEGDVKDNKQSKMDGMDKTENSELNIVHREVWRTNEEQTMFPIQCVLMKNSLVGTEEKDMEKDGRISEELCVLPETSHVVTSYHLSSTAESSCQAPQRVMGEIFEQEDEDVEIDVVGCSGLPPVPLIAPLITLDDWTSSASSNEVENEEDEEIDVVGEETD